MPVNTFVAGNVVTAAGHNDNWALAVLTDTSRTITVTHTWTATQTFTGGWTAAAACTISVGGLTVAGTSYIGDTANAKATLGLTINQGAADDEILALKSSDVAHGVTDLSETDTYASASKVNATQGGLLLRGFSTSTRAVFVQGVHTTDDTNKTTGGLAPVTLRGLLKNGTSAGAMGADANIVVIQDGGALTRFIFDVEGTFHADVGSTTF